MIKALLFDLDGTLLDTSCGILESVKFTIQELSLPTLPEEVMLRFVGPPIQNSLMEYCGLDMQRAQEAANVFRDYYRQSALFKARLYDGILDLLNTLRRKQIVIGVATYKREDYAIKLLSHFGIDRYCSVMHGADNENKFSKGDIVSMCCKELQVDTSDIVLIGDTEHDALGAQKAGIGFVAVTWGFGYKTGDKLSIKYPCLGVADTPQDILTLF